jgi:hypothetical protein
MEIQGSLTPSRFPTLRDILHHRSPTSKDICAFKLLRLLLVGMLVFRNRKRAHVEGRKPEKGDDVACFTWLWCPNVSWARGTLRPRVTTIRGLKLLLPLDRYGRSFITYRIMDNHRPSRL